MNIKPLERDADLAVIGKSGIEQLLRDYIRIAIVENDARIIAAQFKRHAL